LKDFSPKETNYTVSRRSQDNPFYGTSKATIIYLKAGHGSAPREYNVVIAGSAYRLQLTDGWDFYPPTDITSEQGVHFDRKLQATRTEITQPTGNKITLKDENDQDVEVDELEVTGYTYTPRGYSVFLPYDLTLTAENAKVFVPSAITDGDDWRVTFTEVTNKQMEAYTPYYIVVSGEEEVSLSTSGRTTIGSHITTVNTQTVGTDFEFKGTTTAISNASLYDAEKPAYILQSDGNWHKVAPNTENAYVPPFRAYLQASNAKTANQLTTMLNAIELSDVLDNNAVLASYVGQTVTVTLRDRTLYKDGYWNTLCLPFAVALEGSPLEGAEAMVLDGNSSGLSGTTLTLNFANISPSGEQEGLIAAGTPFIIRWGTPDNHPDADLVNPVFTGVTIDATMHDVAFTGGSFKGTYAGIPFDKEDQSILLLGTNSTLYWPESGASIGACRAYFLLSDPEAPVRAFVLNFGDGGSEEMGIRDNKRETITNNHWYSLDGVRLDGKPTKKGLYIVGGKKVVIP
jgi:hypothetical protein